MRRAYKVQDFRSNEWKSGHPSKTWALRMGLKRNNGMKDFSREFRKEFEGVLTEPKSEPLGTRWNLEKTKKNNGTSRGPVPEGVRWLVNETLQKYELHPDYKFLHRVALAAGATIASHYSDESTGQARNFIEFSLYHAIKAGKPVPVNNLLGGFLGLDGESATDRILQERELEHRLFGLDNAQLPNTEKEVQKFKEYIEYLADRYAFSGVEVGELIEAGRYGARRAIMKFGLDGDSPEYMGLVFSHINWYIQQAANLSPEERLRTPDAHELIHGYEEKKAYELKLVEEEEEHKRLIAGKKTTFGKAIRKFTNQREYKAIKDKIAQAEKSLDEDSDASMVALNLLIENVPRYKGKNIWDFKFRGNCPEEAKRQTLEKIRYILEEERGIPIDDVPRVVDTNFIDNLGFVTFRVDVYKGRTIDLINDLYPGRFKPWEFRNKRGWLKGGGKGGPGAFARGGVELFNEATRWLVEEKLQIPVEEAPDKLTADVYVQYGLNGALSKFFDGSTLHALAAAYPDQFTPEDFIQAVKKRLEIVVNDEILAGIISRYEGFMWRHSARYFDRLSRKQQPLLRHLIDVDDLVQMGRNAVWEALKQHPEISLENAASYHPLIVRYITNQIKQGVYTVYRKADVLALSDSLNRLAYTRTKGDSKRTVEEMTGETDSGFDVTDDEQGNEDSVTFSETVTEGRREHLYPILETLGQKSQRFKKFLRDTLYDSEFQGMEETILQTAAQLENNYIWNRADFDPIDEGMKILRTLPRFEKIHTWQVKAHPWSGHRGYGGGQGEQTHSVSERLKGAELAREATRWLFEVKLGVDVENIPKVVSTGLFHKNGFGGLLTSAYDGSAWAAVEDAYPGRWKPWEFKHAPHLWDKGDLSYRIAGAATRWVIEEKLKTTPDRVQRSDFDNNRLGGMLVQLFKGSFRAAIRNAYPEIYDPSKMELLRSFLRQNLSPAIYNMIPERVVLNRIPKRRGWDPVEAGMQMVAKIDPEYANKPLWQFKFNNRPNEKYSRELVVRSLREAMETHGVAQSDAETIVTSDWIKEQRLEEPITALYGSLSPSTVSSAVADVLKSKEAYRPRPSQHSVYMQELSEEKLRGAVENFFGVVLSPRKSDRDDYEKGTDERTKQEEPVPTQNKAESSYQQPKEVELSQSQREYYGGFLNMLGSGRRIKIPYNGFAPESMKTAILGLAKDMNKRVIAQLSDDSLYVQLASG